MPTIINFENIENDLGAQINTAIEYINKGCTLCGGDSHKIEECNILTNIQHIHDKKVPTRARLTLPSELRVETMSDGTCNVVAQVPLLKGTRFGPFEAKKIQILHPLITFPIKLFKFDDNDTECYFDPSNEDVANWMCFISVANDILEQNLICYQMKNNIYYSAIRDIKVGEYLKVWYAAYYAEKMGTAVLKRVDTEPQHYADDIKVEKRVNQKIAETLPAESLGATTDTSIWVCRFCKTTIKNIVLFSTHLQQHYKDLALKTFTCTICYKHCISEKSLLSHQITIHSLNAATQKLPLLSNKQNEITTTSCIVDTTSSTNNNSIQHFFNNKKDTDNSTTVVESTTAAISTTSTQQIDTNNIFTKMNVYDTDLDFSTKTIVNDSLVGGQTQDQLDQNTSLLVDNITLNYNHHDDLNNVMLTKISELNEHLKFDIKDTTTTGSDLNDSLNTDSLHDILCEDDSKASKIAQEKSIADFSLDFVVESSSNGGLTLNTSSTDNTSTLSTNDTTTDNSNTTNNLMDLPPPTSGPPYYCDICRKEFQNIEYLIRHLKKHSGEFTCIDCFAVFGRRENFLNHSCKWDPQKKKNSYECMYCSKAFSEQKYLNRHVQRHNKQRKTCPKCATVFENESDLEHHVCDTSKPMVIEKKFECDICKNRYIKNSYLRGHILKCHKKPAEQQQAKKLTDNNSNSQTTTISDSTSNTSQCICYMCGESFSNATTLKVHLLIHQPKQYECDVCDKKFHRSETCEQHKLTHQDVTYQCKTCNKIFKSQKSLKKHQLIHNDSSECHKCEFCNRIFIQKHNLEKHINFQHSADQPKFPCDLCTNVFTSANNLKDHKATHNLTDSLNNTSKQLSCEYCKKNFTKTNLLKTHYVTTHLNRMFSCPYCTTIVKHRASIRRHLSKSHREKRGEWDNSDFIGKLVSQNKKPPDEDTTAINNSTINSTTQHLVPIEPVTSTINLNDNQQQILTSSTTNTNDSIILQHSSAASTNDEMDTNDINQNHSLVVEQQLAQQPETSIVKNENYVTQTTHHQQQHHLLPKMYNTMSQVVDSTHHHQLFTTTNNEFQNIIYLKNNHDVDLDLEKITEYSNLDSATAKLSQFSDLSSTSSQIQVTSQHSHATLHQSHNNTDNLPKFTRIDRSNDFDMMDIQSLISTDSGMIEFPNELVERSDTTQFTNNMNLQLHNAVNLHGNSNLLHMTDEDREVTLGKNAFILDDGTIVEPQEAGNLMFYVLNQS